MRAQQASVQQVKAGLDKLDQVLCRLAFLASVDTRECTDQAQAGLYYIYSDMIAELEQAEHLLSE